LQQLSKKKKKEKTKMQMSTEMNEDGTMKVTATYTISASVNVSNNAPEEEINKGFERACDLVTATAFRDANDRTRTNEVASKLQDVIVPAKVEKLASRVRAAKVEMLPKKPATSSAAQANPDSQQTSESSSTEPTSDQQR
jgi:hypothetical protein